MRQTDAVTNLVNSNGFEVDVTGGNIVSTAEFERCLAFRQAG